MESERLKSEARRRKILLKSEERMQKLLGMTEVQDDPTRVSDKVTNIQNQYDGGEPSEDTLEKSEAEIYQKNTMAKSGSTQSWSTGEKVHKSPAVPFYLRNDKYLIILSAMMSRIFAQPGLYFQVLIFLEATLLLKNVFYSHLKSSDVTNLLLFAIQSRLSSNQQSKFSAGIKILMDSLVCMFLYSFTFITMHVAWEHFLA